MCVCVCVCAFLCTISPCLFLLSSCWKFLSHFLLLCFFFRYGEKVPLLLYVPLSSCWEISLCFFVCFFLSLPAPPCVSFPHALSVPGIPQETSNEGVAVLAVHGCRLGGSDVDRIMSACVRSCCSHVPFDGALISCLPVCTTRSGLSNRHYLDTFYDGLQSNKQQQLQVLREVVRAKKVILIPVCNASTDNQALC